MQANISVALYQTFKIQSYKCTISCRMIEIICVSGPNPRLFSLSTYNGSHILFQSGYALFQLFRKILQEIGMLIHKQSKTQQVCFLLRRHKRTMYRCSEHIQSKLVHHKRLLLLSEKNINDYVKQLDYRG